MVCGSVADVMHWVVMGCGGLQGVFASMCASALFVGASLDALSALNIAYNRARLRLDDESWLRNNCRDPVFYSKMKAHTNVCADVEANARVGAFWAAMREVSDDSRAFLQPLAFHVLFVVAVVTLLIPLCCLCTQRLGVCQARRPRCLPSHYSRMCVKDV